MLKKKKVLIPLMAALVFIAVYVNVFRGGKDEAKAAVRTKKKTSAPKEPTLKGSASAKKADRSTPSTGAPEGDTERNPFLTSEEQRARSDEAARLANALLADKEETIEEEVEEELPPPPPVNVTVILMGSTSKVAVLNGVTLREGDFLGEELLLEIRSHQVVLARGDSQRTISINGGAK